MNRRIFLLASLVMSSTPFASAWAHNGVDHGAYHGGVVRPYKDLHFEAAVLPAGGVQLYFSDKMGEPLPASTVSQVAAEIEYPGGKVQSIDLAIDPTGVFWAGPSAPLADAKAVLRIGFTFRGAPATVELPGAALIAAAKKGPPKKVTGKKIADGHH